MKRVNLIGVTLLVAGVMGSASAQTITHTVDCSTGQTISDALEQGDSRKPLVLLVRGTCSEAIVIRRDDVTLRADPATSAVVNAPDAQTNAIDIRAMRVVIDGLNVTGGRIGIFVHGASYVRIRNATVRDSSLLGMQMTGCQDVAVNNSKVQYTAAGVRIDQASVSLTNSEISYNKGFGVHLGQMGSLVANGSIIKANGSHGLGVFNGSTATMYENTISDNGTDSSAYFRQGVYVSSGYAEFRGGSISNNAGFAIVLVGRSSIYNTTISGNGGGVSVLVGSAVLIDASSISDNKDTGVQLNMNAMAQIGNGTTIQRNAGDGISLLLGSKLNLLSTTDVTENAGWGLYCRDRESSVNDASMLILSPPNGAGGVSPGCTGY